MCNICNCRRLEAPRDTLMHANLRLFALIDEAGIRNRVEEACDKISADIYPHPHERKRGAEIALEICREHGDQELVDAAKEALDLADYLVQLHQALESGEETATRSTQILGLEREPMDGVAPAAFYDELTAAIP